MNSITASAMSVIGFYFFFFSSATNLLKLLFLLQYFVLHHEYYLNCCNVEHNVLHLAVGLFC